MKNLLLLCISGLFIISSCTNSKNETSNTGNSDSTKTINTTFTENFYKRLEGTIAGKRVTVHLKKINGEYNGTYYYDGAWLNLTTDTLIGKDSLVLTENSYYESYNNQDSKQPHIKLKWTGNGFKGQWKNGDGTKSYPVMLQENYPDGSYAFSTGMYQDSVKAFTGKSKSPAAQISFKYLKPTKDDDADQWLDKQLKSISGIRQNPVDRAIGFKKIADAYLSDYKKEITDLQEKGPDRGFSEWMNYTNNSQQSIVYNDNGFVVIDFMADEYTGGAHGNYGSTMYCLDVKNKKQMVLSDVVKVDSNALQTLLEKNLRKLYNIKAQDKISSILFDDFLKENHNFYFNSNGLAFLYNPYEVASYAQGQIVVFIPFTELKPYLVPDFSSRMRLNK